MSAAGEDELAEIVLLDKEAERHRDIRGVRLAGADRLDDIRDKASAGIPGDVGARIETGALHAEAEQILIDAARRLDSDALALEQAPS